MQWPKEKMLKENNDLQNIQTWSISLKNDCKCSTVIDLLTVLCPYLYRRLVVFSRKLSLSKTKYSNKTFCRGMRLCHIRLIYCGFCPLHDRVFVLYESNCVMVAVWKRILWKIDLLKSNKPILGQIDVTTYNFHCGSTNEIDSLGPLFSIPEPYGHNKDIIHYLQS